MKQYGNYAIIGLGCAAGAMLRYLCELTIGKLVSNPFSILLVNLAGCFLIGLLTALVLQKRLSLAANKLMITGFCGGLTTFSTFVSGIETFFTQGQLILALTYIGLNMLLGLLAVHLGLKLVLEKKYPD